MIGLHTQLKEIEDEKSYWLNRLNRTMKQLDKKKAKRHRTCKITNKNKFLTVNLQHSNTKSLLLTNGMLSINQSTRSAMQRSRSFNRSRSPSMIRNRLGRNAKSIQPKFNFTNQFAETLSNWLYFLFPGLLELDLIIV